MTAEEKQREIINAAKRGDDALIDEITPAAYEAWTRRHDFRDVCQAIIDELRRIKARVEATK